MKLALCYRAISRKETLAIHREGCSDIARTEVQKWSAQVQIVEVPDMAAAVNTMLDDEMRAMGWDESTLKIYPCCDGAE